MATSVESQRPGRTGWFDAIGIAFVLLLAFAAFDDITTDNATSFTVEYAVLVACGLWLLVTSVRLLGRGQRKLGAFSLVALAGALWAQRGIRPGITPGFWPEYVMLAAAFFWFAVLTLILFVSAGLRRRIRPNPTSTPAATRRGSGNEHREGHTIPQ